MKTWILILLGAMLVSAGARPCCGDDPPDKKPSREEQEKRKEDWKKLSPEEREAKRKEIKARLEKRICELRGKQTNATITVQETKELSRSEQIFKRFEQDAAAKNQKAADPAAPDHK